MDDILSKLCKTYPIQKHGNNIHLIQELFTLLAKDTYTPLSWVDRTWAYDLAVFCGRDLNLAQTLIALIIEKEAQTHVLLKYRYDTVNRVQIKTWTEYIGKLRDKLKIFENLNKDQQIQCVKAITPRHSCYFLREKSLREWKQILITLAHKDLRVVLQFPFLQRKYYKYQGKNLNLEEFEMLYLNSNGLCHILQIWNENESTRQKLCQEWANHSKRKEDYPLWLLTNLSKLGDQWCFLLCYFYCLGKNSISHAISAFSSIWSQTTLKKIKISNIQVNSHGMHYENNSGTLNYTLNTFVEDHVIPRLHEPHLETVEDYLSQYKFDENINTKEFIAKTSNFEIKDTNDVIAVICETLLDSRSYSEFFDVFFEVLIFMKKEKTRLECVEHIKTCIRKESVLFLRMCKYMDVIYNTHTMNEITSDIRDLVEIVLDVTL